MRRKFYLHKRGGVFYACLVNQKTGLSMSARSTGERDRDAALIVVSGWLRDGLPGKGGERRKVEAAFDLDGILRGIRKAELDSGGALAIVSALKERGLIDIGAVPAGKGSVDFVSFLSDFFDYDKSAYVKDRLAHGHSIGRRYCYESLKMIRLFWEPAFKSRTLASVTRNELKSFSLSLPVDKSASYKNSILNAGLIPLGWAYEEGMIPADIAKDFERYSGKATKRGVLTVEEAGTLFAKTWADGAAMAANLLSATTGMRQGEVLAVRGGDIGEGVLNAAHSWSAADGLKSPKNGESRRVPLLPEVRNALLSQLAANPHTDIPEGERFVFWGLAHDKPRIDGGFMLDALYAELEAMGIGWRARNIVFHGWRHFYAARMADIEAADKVSRITGHKSRAVFDAYADHVTEAAIVDMGKAAAVVFAGVLAGAAMARA
ncbi:MAG: integrase [Treponema sp.]|jgi:integrase|nr:integrase [Treponema sp.]